MTVQFFVIFCIKMRNNLLLPFGCCRSSSRRCLILFRPLLELPIKGRFHLGSVVGFGFAEDLFELAEHCLSAHSCVELVCYSSSIWEDKNDFIFYLFEYVPGFENIILNVSIL